MHCSVSGPYAHLAPFFILEAESLYYIRCKKSSGQMNNSQTGVETALKATMVFNFSMPSVNALVLPGFCSICLVVK